MNILTHTKGAVYIAMSSSELDTLQSAFRAAGGRWSTFIIWAKNTFTRCAAPVVPKVCWWRPVSWTTCGRSRTAARGLM